jgi:hypothetical protein
VLKITLKKIPYKINPVVDQCDLQASFLAWFLSWKVYSECTTLQGIIIVYFTMKNTKNLERKSSADRITCFLPLSYNPLLQAKTRLLLDRGADMHFRDVKCMSVLEHTSRSSCEIKITYEKKKAIFEINNYKKI